MRQEPETENQATNTGKNYSDYILEAFIDTSKNILKGKHPTPYDFFNVFKKHAGDDINLFLKACYFEYGYADLGIRSVDKNKVIIENIGNIPVSIKLEITYDDNSTESIYKNLSIWKTGVTEYPVNLKANKAIKKILLGDKLIPDLDLSNNLYQKQNSPCETV